MTETQTPQTEQVDNRCRFCGQPVRWSTAYDEPHWVHVRTVDILRCPQGRPPGWTPPV